MRSGKLVRMDRGGALPDRCVICGAEAGSARIARKLYWSPAPWKVGAFAVPLAVLGAGIAVQSQLMLTLFWPAVLVLVVANMFVRTSLMIELPVCGRHRMLRSVLRGLSLACVVGAIASVPLFRTWDHALSLLWTCIAGLLLLAVLQALTGVQSIGLKRLSDEHTWLSGTGERFRATLPEMPS